MTEIKEPRDLEDIIVIIQKFIPENEFELHNSLNKLLQKLSFQSIEVRKGSYYWIIMINILNKYIPVIKEEWQIKIRDIINYNKL
jgi:hypothetical protein